MKYLIIDDDPKMRKMIKQIICFKDDTFIECPELEDAVNFYASHLPDYVLIEIQARKMEGFIALKKIHSKFPDAHIIIITDYDTTASRLAALQAGAKAFFSKEYLFEVKNYINNEKETKSKLNY